MYNNKLVLETGADISFPQGRLVFKQPSIKEIALFGESLAFSAAEFLNFNANMLRIADKKVLGDKTDFDILMIILQSDDPKVVEQREHALDLLQLLCPDYQIILLPTHITFTRTIESSQESGILDRTNFEDFKEIIDAIFCLTELTEKSGDRQYKPANQQAALLAQKFQARRKKLKQLKGEDKESKSMFSRIISILSVGLHIDILTLSNYTIYQLMDSYNRFILKQNHDAWFKMKVAGAEKLDDPKPWMA